MSVQPEDFASLAVALSQGISEIEWRVSASKAYYCVYHQAQRSVDLCPDNNRHFQMATHKRLADRYIQHPAMGAKTISYVLNSMKRVRHSADYAIGDPFQKTQAEKQTSDMKAFAQRIMSFENQYRTGT